jgi:hypothetical protein
MTRSEQMELLILKVGEIGQRAVARGIGKSPSAVNQVLHGSYRGCPDAILRRVEEVYGASQVQCPVLGEIPLGKCAEHKAREFAATNPQRVRMYRACRACTNKGEMP